MSNKDNNQNDKSEPYYNLKNEVVRQRVELDRINSQLNSGLERLKKVQQTAKLGFWEWVVGSGDLYWSEEIYSIFQKDPKTFKATYENFLQAVHPEDRDAVIQAVNSCLEGDEPYDIDHRLLGDDGNITYVNEQGQLIRDEDGKPAKMFGAVIDITERKKAELAFQESQAQFFAIWEAAAGAMMTVNIKGIITRANPKSEKVFGYENGELLGQNVEILVPEQLREKHVGLRESFQDHELKREMAEGMELFGIRKGQSRIPLEISLIPVWMEGEKEILLDIVDISVRKTLEDKLLQSEKLEAIGRLTGGVAHDLNNFLTVIVGFTELSQLSLEPEHECNNYLKEVAKAGEKARLLIGKMLAFTRQQVMNPEIVNVNHLLSDSEGFLSQLSSANVELSIDLDQGLHQVYLDPTQFEQVISNLVVNASDAMPDGGRLIISTNNVELDKEFLSMNSFTLSGIYIEISISDTGTGMTREVVEKIFDPFYTTKDKGKGVGLGLATVYGIIKQSKGEVLVFSEPNEGTTFKIYFPVTDSSLPTQESSDSNSTSKAQDKRILLIDDDESVLALTKRILKDAGYEIIEKLSAEEALEYIHTKDSSEKIDLIITDIVLTGISGHEFYQQLQAENIDIPVIFMSGFADRALDAMSGERKNSEFLNKPFSRKTLLDKVLKQLSED